MKDGWREGRKVGRKEGRRNDLIMSHQHYQTFLQFKNSSIHKSRSPITRLLSHILHSKVQFKVRQLAEFYTDRKDRLSEPEKKHLARPHKSCLHSRAGPISPWSSALGESHSDSCI